MKCGVRLAPKCSRGASDVNGGRSLRPGVSAAHPAGRAPAFVLVARALARRHRKGTAVSRALIFTPQSRGTPHRPRSMHPRGQRYGYVFMVASRHAPRAKRILTAHHKNASSAGCAVRRGCRAARAPCARPRRPPGRVPTSAPASAVLFDLIGLF
ncbi:hypothetical protein EVAR_88510_1 [Eumeta japonica]|uniref:Uncharacterized protein n=1 Tax=Eumeta variegata TaxID=151549 RepID=A0A4C1XTF1_EUMVA|nr:hypothetical protein EVAR_88510_1 [Eumeta japonica]